MKNGLIIVEGNIGVGKSTFSKMLAESLGGEFIAEPDETTNPYLEDYYKDPARWAFEMQMFLLSRRYRAQKYAQSLVRHKGGFVVMDRSYYGDVCFAEVQYDLGYFSNRDYGTYMAHHADMKSTLEPPALAIFLDANNEDCMKRIAKRITEKTGRACESTIQKDYLDRISSELQRLKSLLSYSCFTKCVDWYKERSPRQIKKECKKLAQNIQTELPEHIPDWWVGKGVQEVSIEARGKYTRLARVWS